jgi:hypothetical protein
MIIPIKAFEEMTPKEQQAHLEDLLVEFGFGQNGDLEAFLRTVKGAARRRSRKAQRENGAYVTAGWAAEKIGKSEDAIRKEFFKETTGVKKRTFSGRNRRTVHTLLISKNLLRQRYPDAEL